MNDAKADLILKFLNEAPASFWKIPGSREWLASTMTTALDDLDNDEFFRKADEFFDGPFPVDSPVSLKTAKIHDIDGRVAYAIRLVREDGFESDLVGFHGEDECRRVQRFLARLARHKFLACPAAVELTCVMLRVMWHLARIARTDEQPSQPGCPSPNYATKKHMKAWAKEAHAISGDILKHLSFPLDMSFVP